MEKKNVNQSLDRSCHGDSLSIKFEVPECMLSEDAQQRLTHLLDKQSLIEINQLSLMPIIVTRAMLARVDREQLLHHLDSLLRDYIQITSNLIERARNPFYVTEDLLPEHFKNACDMLDLMEDCIRKMSTLLKCSVQFLGSSMITQVTIDADRVLEEKAKLCQFLLEEKGKYRVESNDHTKKTIISKFIHVKNTLDTFLAKFTKN